MLLYRSVDATFDLLEHFNQTLLEDRPAKEPLEVREVQLYVAILFPDLQTLHNVLDPGVNVGDELLLDEQIGDDLNFNL